MTDGAATNQLLQDFRGYARQQLAHYFSPDAAAPAVEVPELDHPGLRDLIPDPAETVALLCALAPHLQPNFYESLMQEFLPAGGEFPEFGGTKGTSTRYMLPTGDTLLFLLGGTDPGERAKHRYLFNTSHWFHSRQLLWLEDVREGEPRTSGRIILAPDLLDLFTEGYVRAPAFGSDFPARLLTTRQSWNDIVLFDATREHLDDLYAWLHCNGTVMQDEVLARKIKPGYRALFHGPSGTGKTLAATLLGQEFSKDVYRIDLSQVVSKYIGETEKNLEKIFRKAEMRDWILFFDEADALFGKRSSVQNAHDKYANQEVSYLLQRVEDFPGLVILASNFKSNIDGAFLRRFNTIIEFPMPGPAERRQLWEKALPASIPIADDVDLRYLADKYELTGSAINQIVHYAALQMHHLRLPAISSSLLAKGIRKELRKEDKLSR